MFARRLRVCPNKSRYNRARPRNTPRVLFYFCIRLRVSIRGNRKSRVVIVLPVSRLIKTRRRDVFLLAAGRSLVFVFRDYVKKVLRRVSLADSAELGVFFRRKAFADCQKGENERRNSARLFARVLLLRSFRIRAS